MITKFHADVDDPDKTKADLADYFSDDFKDFDRHPLAPDFLSDKNADVGFSTNSRVGLGTSCTR